MHLATTTAGLLSVAGDKASMASGLNADSRVTVRKLDDELQIVWGEVYAPGFPDSQGDFMTAPQIREMSYRFVAKGNMTAIDKMHDQVEGAATIVESFIARDNDPDFIPGSWVLGVHVPDRETWAGIKKGDFNGFSLDGIGHRVPRLIELDLPDELTGETADAAGHHHGFIVKFDTDGNFLGGQTLPARDGHVHRILRGTATETTNDHSHRFSFVEGLGMLNA